MQEIEFFEEGEPMIDGEPGDLKVGMRCCVGSQTDCGFFIV